jgi:hypothetical protein
MHAVNAGQAAAGGIGKVEGFKAGGIVYVEELETVAGKEIRLLAFFDAEAILFTFEDDELVAAFFCVLDWMWVV